MPIENVWDITCNQLYFVNKAYNLLIHQFVLMPNHYHLVATTPESNISEAIGYFAKETTREIQKYSGRCNQIYGGRFHRTILDKNIYFLNTYKYVYRNPVKANLSKNVEEYRYSTLNGLLGFEQIVIPTLEDTLLFSNYKTNLEWLNKATLKEHDLMMSRALKYSRFRLPKVKKKLSVLETQLY